MTSGLIISLVTCVSTVIGTVIALLSYLKKKDKEYKKSRQKSWHHVFGSFVKTSGRWPNELGISFLFNIT